jgi:hypothetical protein
MGSQLCLDTKAIGFSSSLMKGILGSHYISHVRKAESLAKFWLEPEPEVAEAYGFTSHELRELLGVSIEKTEPIRRYWNEHFGG